MKQLPLLLLSLLLGCTSPTEKPNDVTNANPQKIENKTLIEVLKEDGEMPKQELYLNGIYEYDYLNNTVGMNENQYIAFLKESDDVKAWYFGTSDEFDEAREGYLPGYFVTGIKNLTTKGDSIFFSISVSNNECYETRPPIGLVDKTILDEEYEKWNSNNTSQTVNYSGMVDGLKLYINIFGETRTYRKTRNFFHPGIDNYDKSKCRTEPLLTVHENIDSLTEIIILNFLNTFSVTCEANVEFSEMSNEMLFRVLTKSPELVINVLSKNSSQLDTTSIFEELESPLHDLIPIDSIKASIELLNVDSEFKEAILTRLNMHN